MVTFARAFMTVEGRVILIAKNLFFKIVCNAYVGNETSQL